MIDLKHKFIFVHIPKSGGQSICDRGSKALPGIIEEIVKKSSDFKMLLTTGGGTRSRHIYSIGLELGMPTGVIARFGTTISEQNALLVATLLTQNFLLQSFQTYFRL